MATFEIDPATGAGASITVSGDGDPDPNGYYFETGLHNGWRYFARHDEAYHLWADPFDQYYLTTILDEIAPGFWANTNPGPLGPYGSGAPYTGNPTVTKKPYRSPLGDGTVVTRKTTTGFEAHQYVMPFSPKEKARFKAIAAFTQASHMWFELSPAMKLRWTGDGTKVLMARNGAKFLSRGMRRWMQVQMPLLLAGFPIQTDEIPRVPYEIADLAIKEIHPDGLHVLLDWLWKRNSTEDERVVLHASQLQPRHIHSDVPWKYSRLTGSWDYSVSIQDPGWQWTFQWSPLLYLVTPGETLQMYARFELMDNPDPPASAIGSFMTTEDWTKLRVVRPYP